MCYRCLAILKTLEAQIVDKGGWWNIADWIMFRQKLRDHIKEHEDE